MWLWMWLMACSGPVVDEVSVVVAARDLWVGVPIGEEDVVLVMMKPDYVPAGVFISPVDVIGRVPAERILANEPIRGRRLADAELQRQLEAIVPRGLEVITARLRPAGREVVPRQDVVDLLSAEGTAVATAVPILQVYGDRVAVMATPDQMSVISTTRGDLEAVVRATE